MDDFITNGCIYASSKREQVFMYTNLVSFLPVFVPQTSFVCSHLIVFNLRALETRP
jgi:hypothetical protein